MPAVRLVTAGFLALVVLAGCTAEPAPADDPADPVATVPTSLIETGPAVGPDLDATTAAAPELIVGEWWRIRFDSDFYDAAGAEVLRVVAAADEDGYIFGMPHENWLKEAISFHAPAFGNVAKDLSYDTHNERFAPLKFPLVAGDSWETTFATAPLVASVESADEHTAVIVFRSPPSDPTPEQTVMQAIMGGGDGVFMRLTYDARLHEVSRMESFIGSWEVIEHGFEFRGWVSVPDGEHTAIDYGVFGPDANNPLPTRTVEVGQEFNRITVMHFISAISPGSFRLTSTAPDGTAFATEFMATAAGSRTNFFEVANPGGTWAQEDLSAGAGATYTMGIAYQQYDILVPEGDQRPTHGHEVVR